jgi:hypothetical protein
MKKFWCFLGVHEFTIHKSGTVEISHRDGSESLKNYYDLRCSCCGKMKEVVL